MFPFLGHVTLRAQYPNRYSIIRKGGFGGIDVSAELNPGQRSIGDAYGISTTASRNRPGDADSKHNVGDMVGNTMGATQPARLDVNHPSAPWPTWKDREAIVMRNATNNSKKETDVTVESGFKFGIGFSCATVVFFLIFLAFLALGGMLLLQEFVQSFYTSIGG
ncbi:MAG: hypothetical protein OXG85_10825 [Chloroflexi bacterium]|nr:hypothetical protein [Chloroflexota bacterium]